MDRSQCRIVSEPDSAETKPETATTGDGESLYERLGGTYGIAGAVDDLVDCLYENDAVNQNPETREFHEEEGHAGFKYLVTAWSIEATGGPEVYAGRDMEDAHEHLELSDHEFDVVYTAILQSLHQAGVPEQKCGDHRELPGDGGRRSGLRGGPRLRREPGRSLTGTDSNIDSTPTSTSRTGRGGRHGIVHR